MRRASEILKELGFNSQSPRTTQEAFLRHLNASAAAISAQNFSANAELVVTEQQLSFDSEVLGTQSKPTRVANNSK